MLSERPLSPMPIWTGNSTKICITLLNINGLLSHFQDLCHHHHIMASNIISLTETWLTPSVQSQPLHIPNFDLKRADRMACYSHVQLSTQSSSFRWHGGVLNYIHDSLLAIASPHAVKGIEYLHISVFNSINNNILNVITVYRPPAQNIKQFLTQFRKLLNIVNTDKPTIICGDFNVDAIAAKHHELFKICADKGFAQVVPEPTFIQGSCLDHVYCNKLHSVELRVIPVSFSPHAAVQLCCNL